MSQKEWEANQQKHIDADLQFEKDMAVLDAIEQSEKAWDHEVKTAVEKWWRKNHPFAARQFDDNKDKYYDIRFEVAVEPHLCEKPSGIVYEKFTCYRLWDVPIDAVCSKCDSTLIVLDETIRQVIAKPIPRCVGCSTGMYQHEEGTPALCNKCDKIWTNINQTFEYNVGQMSMVSPMPGQILRRLSDFDAGYEKPASYDIVKEEKNANLISSEVACTDLHKPVLDLDLPCKLIPSTHAGHYHLYINHAMKWEQYQKLLNILVDCGIIQPGYRNASFARGFSSVRLPWIKKKPKKVEDAGQD